MYLHERVFHMCISFDKFHFVSASDILTNGLSSLVVEMHAFTSMGYSVFFFKPQLTMKIVLLRPWPLNCALIGGSRLFCYDITSVLCEKGIYRGIDAHDIVFYELKARYTTRQGAASNVLKSSQVEMGLRTDRVILKRFDSFIHYG